MAVKAASAKVIPIAAAKEKQGKKLSGKMKKESERKWGKAVMARGFLIIPSIIVRAQARLGLDAAHLNVLLQLADHWWEAGRLPFPSKATIAARMGVTPRHVQRYLTALAEAGLIRRIPRYGTQGGQLNNAYDLGGLVEKLKKLEPAFKKEQEEARVRRRDLEKPGGGRRLAAAAASE